MFLSVNPSRQFIIVIRSSRIFNALGENKMKITVINGSPSAQNSITLQTVLYIEALFPQCSFEYLDAGLKIRLYEKDFSVCEKALKEADLILFAYPVYTFLVPSQLHRFIELMKENGIDVKDKYATQITTSKHFYDVTAHRFIEDNCNDLGMKYIRGLSADMDDLLKKKGQKDARTFFDYVLYCMENDLYEPARYPARYHLNPYQPKGVNVAEAVRKTVHNLTAVIVADAQDDSPLMRMIEAFRADLPLNSTLVNIRDFPFKGGCLGCFHCAASGKCVYNDGFDEYLREHIQKADAIIYAYTLKDHSMGSRFKMFDDRQFCNGHRTVTMGKPIGYLVSGNLDNEPNMRMVMEARSEAGGNFHAGIASDQNDPDTEIRKLAQTVGYAVTHSYTQPANFYGVGGLKIFRDLIWQMQGLMKEDHRFYKKHGFYDFPQKKAGTMLAMYAVGAMMSNQKLNQKIGSKMTEGMVMPYKKIIAKAKASSSR